MDTLLQCTRAVVCSSWMIMFAACEPYRLRRLGRSPSTVNPTPAPTPDTGTLLVSITDADGDFVGYSVDVLSVTVGRGAAVGRSKCCTRRDAHRFRAADGLIGPAGGGHLTAAKSSAARFSNT